RLSEAIARYWRATTERGLVARTATSQEGAAAGRLPADVGVFSTRLRGALAEKGLIFAVDGGGVGDTEFNGRDVFDQIRLLEMKWGKKTVATSLGSPQLLLAYRADLFEKLGIAAPADWKDYEQLTKRLADRTVLDNLVPEPDAAWHAALEPL